MAKRTYPVEQHVNPLLKRADVLGVDQLLSSKGLPTYSELASALCEVLDGETHHDIVQLGLSQDDAANINIIRHAVKPLWLEELAKTNG